jgi:ketol-acid reductoisomerase
MAQIDSQLIKKYKIGIIGYGSQGQAQAHNLKDSGCDVTIVLRGTSSKIEMAKKDGFNIENLQNAAKNLDVLVFLAPDEEHAGIYKNIEPYLKKNSCLIFAHGFAINFGQINPRADLDVVMVAPKGIGPMVRRLYTQGSGVAALVGVHQKCKQNGRKNSTFLCRCFGLF